HVSDRLGTSDKAEQKQRTSKNSTYEIKIVPRAVWQTPSHGGENLKYFGDVRKHDYDQTDRAQWLQKSPDCHSMLPHDLTMSAFGTILSGKLLLGWRGKC